MTSTSERNHFAQQLFDRLPRRYDRLAEVLSMGQNRRWRRALVEVVVACEPGRVADVASGTAGVAIELADRTGGLVTAVDLTETMLRQGRANVRARGLDTRIQVAVGRAEQLPFADSTFDAVSFTYLLRYVDDPAATVRELVRVLRPGGVIASLDFLVPPNRLWSALWWCYTRAVLPLAGWVTGGPEWYTVGRFLGPNITNHYRRYPLDRAVRMWEEAGISDVEVRVMSLGGGLVMWGRKAGG